MLGTVVKLVFLYFFCECVENILWECSEYSSIHKDFISNFDIHLKSSFDNAKYIFDQSIWECNDYFDHWFSNTKAFLCGIGICTGRFI